MHNESLFFQALDLAFRSGQVTVVAQIAEELDDSADPAIVTKCAEYFTTNRQYDKAANLLITAKQVITEAALHDQQAVRQGCQPPRNG